MSDFIDADDPNTVVVYTDGSCYPNPSGQGGWAFYVTYLGKQAVRYGSFDDATNNMMELLAIVRSLEFIPSGPSYTNPLLIFTDSKYALNALTDWVDAWKISGWRTSNGSEVKNRELIELGEKLIHTHSEYRLFQLRWVPGHSGIPENELVDRAANNARTQQHTNWSPKSDCKTIPDATY